MRCVTCKCDCDKKDAPRLCDSEYTRMTVPNKVKHEKHFFTSDRKLKKSKKLSKIQKHYVITSLQELQCKTQPNTRYFQNTVLVGMVAVTVMDSYISTQSCLADKPPHSSCLNPCLLYLDYFADTCIVTYVPVVSNLICIM